MLQVVKEVAATSGPDPVLSFSRLFRVGGKGFFFRRAPFGGSAWVFKCRGVLLIILSAYVVFAACINQG